MLEKSDTKVEEGKLMKESLMRKIFIMIKTLLKLTILGQFYLIWTAPTDGETTKSIKDQSMEIEPNQNFAKYVFHNIVTAQKGGNYAQS